MIVKALYLFSFKNLWTNTVKECKPATNYMKTVTQGEGELNSYKAVQRRSQVGKIAVDAEHILDKTKTPKRKQDLLAEEYASDLSQDSSAFNARVLDKRSGQLKEENPTSTKIPQELVATSETAISANIQNSDNDSDEGAFSSPTRRFYHGKKSLQKRNQKQKGAILDVSSNKEKILRRPSFDKSLLKVAVGIDKEREDNSCKVIANALSQSPDPNIRDTKILNRQDNSNYSNLPDEIKKNKHKTKVKQLN